MDNNQIFLDMELHSRMRTLRTEAPLKRQKYPKVVKRCKKMSCVGWGHDFMPKLCRPLELLNLDCAKSEVPAVKLELQVVF